MSTILIVEDDEKNMKLARDILCTGGTPSLKPPTARTACASRCSTVPT